MNLAYRITQNHLVKINVEATEVRPNSMMIIGTMTEEHYLELNKFITVIVVMRMPVTDGTLKYTYRMRPHYVERISRENGICRVKLVTSKFELTEKYVARH